MAMASTDLTLALSILALPLGLAVVRTAHYVLLVVRRKRPARDEEMLRRGDSVLLGPGVRQWFAWVAQPVVSLLARFSSPDQLTVLSFLLSVLAAAVMGSGMIATGGAVALCAASLDYFDGRVARSSERTSVAGNFLDSTLDRWSEVALFIGAALAVREYPIALAACVLAQGSSLVVSYARAKAESLGAELKAGLMQRPERLVTFCLGAILSPVGDRWLLAPAGPSFLFRAMLVALALATTATALRRTRSGYLRLRRQERADPRSGAAPGGVEPPA